MYGDRGDDTLIGGAGNDRLDGGQRARSCGLHRQLVRLHDH
ncbi:hypothetical protein QW131_08940 [Roseibium salinum]|nr:hypothetical protein [Roseibium salinum]